jgi:hypothetical protein
MKPYRNDGFLNQVWKYEKDIWEAKAVIFCYWTGTDQLQPPA